MKSRKLYAAIAMFIIIGGISYAGRGRIIQLLTRFGIIDSYYVRKVKEFNAMPETTGKIVFLGDSITDFVNFAEVLPSYDIINRGIAGDTTSGVLKRLPEVIRLRPGKLFLLIGTNDIGTGVETAPIVRNIRQIISRIQAKTPETRIYLQAVFPTRHFDSRPNPEIQALNTSLKAAAGALHCTFIDLYPLLLDENSELAEEYTLDGLHLTDSAVMKWMKYIAPYLDE